MTNHHPIEISQVAGAIDHTLLSPELTEAETLAGCALAKGTPLASVIVKPCFVRQAVAALKGSTVPVGTVIGFPHGSSTTHVKISEAKRALTEGALELEMVLNLGYLRGGKRELVKDDIRAVCGLAHMNGARVKVVLESGYLSDEERIIASHLAVEAGADWIVTATGFGPSGANLRDAQLIRETVGESVQIKAAGGIHTLQDVLVFINAGCTRVGTDCTEEILGSVMNTLSFHY